jgi:hypothetical protein
MARSVWVSLRRFLKLAPKSPPPEVEPPHPIEESELHTRHHPRAHTYSRVPESFALGSMLLRPDAS